MNKKSILSLSCAGSSFLFAVLTMSSAWAKDMHCNCADPKLNGKSMTKSGTTYNFTCKNTFTAGSDSSSSEYNEFAKVYYTEGTSNDQEVDIKVRPRKNNQCVIAVYNQNKNNKLASPACNNSNETKVSGFNMEKAADGSYNIGGAVQMTNLKEYVFLGIYSPSSSSGPYKLIAGCIENE